MENSLAFGGAAISGEGGGYGFGVINEENAVALLQKVKDELGVNIFDTAPIYGFGTSEERIGKAFKKCREDVIYISKSGVTWDSSKRVQMTNDPKITEEMLHHSLKRMQTDYIDLYMIHWPDPQIDIRFPLEILAKAQAVGKIQHIGLCNTHKEDLQKAQEIVSIKSVQSELNFFNDNVVKELFPLLAEHHIDFMSWGTLDKGILTGRVTRERQTQQYDSCDARSWAPWWKKDKERRLKKFQILDEVKLLLKNNYQLLDLALSFNNQWKEVSTMICGARDWQQWQGLVESLHQKKLPDELLRDCVELRDRFA